MNYPKIRHYFQSPYRSLPTLHVSQGPFFRPSTTFSFPDHRDTFFPYSFCSVFLLLFLHQDPAALLQELLQLLEEVHVGVAGVGFVHAGWQAVLAYLRRMGDSGGVAVRVLVVGAGVFVLDGLVVLAHQQFQVLLRPLEVGCASGDVEVALGRDRRVFQLLKEFGKLLQRIVKRLVCLQKIETVSEGKCKIGHEI